MTNQLREQDKQKFLALFEQALNCAIEHSNNMQKHNQYHNVAVGLATLVNAELALITFVDSGLTNIIVLTPEILAELTEYARQNKTIATLPPNILYMSAHNGKCILESFAKAVYDNDHTDLKYMFGIEGDFFTNTFGEFAATFVQEDYAQNKEKPENIFSRILDRIINLIGNFIVRCATMIFNLMAKKHNATEPSVSGETSTTDSQSLQEDDEEYSVSTPVVKVHRERKRNKLQFSDVDGRERAQSADARLQTQPIAKRPSSNDLYSII